MSKTWKGKQIFMETLLAEGVDKVFGNPGTTEMPLIDSLIDYPQIEYILALHEGVAVMAADAWAQVTGKVAVANLHVGPGLGNGLGGLYNAWEGQTPLVLTAGQQDTRMRLREPLLGHDLVAMAAPLTKWSVQAESADELPAILNRAFKTAREYPSGPVFVSLPINVMEQETTQPPLAPSHIHQASVANPAGVAEAAQLLLGAKQPIIFCGDKVGASGAVQSLVRMAETLGASVYNEVLPSKVNFPTNHPNYRDRGAGDYAMLRKLMAGCDVVLLVGGEFFEEVWFAEGGPLPEDAVAIQIDPSPRNIGRNFPVQCGLVGDPRATLDALLAELDAKSDAGWRANAAQRQAAQVELKEKERGHQQKRLEAGWDNTPMSPARLMAEISQALPPNVAIAGEAITTSPDLTRSIFFDKPGDYLASRGGGIGQGLPSGIGMKVAFPDRPVMVISGDGSANYSMQALWTAAHHKLPIVFVILNNRVYRILKINMNRYRETFGVNGERGYMHLDLTDPEMDYVAIAKGYGMEARRVEDPAQIGDAVREAFASGKPYLLDMVIDGTV